MTELVPLMQLSLPGLCSHREIVEYCYSSSPGRWSPAFAYVCASVQTQIGLSILSPPEMVRTIIANVNGRPA